MIIVGTGSGFEKNSYESNPGYFTLPISRKKENRSLVGAGSGFENRMDPDTGYFMLAISKRQQCHTANFLRSFQHLLYKYVVRFSNNMLAYVQVPGTMR